MNLTDPPSITVPLTAGEYVGNSVVAVIALAALFVAAFIFSKSSTAGLAIGGFGAIIFVIPAFAFLRTVETAMSWPNLAVWCGIIGAGIAAGIAVHILATARGSFGVASWIPPGATLIAGLVAALFDRLNEVLGSIPLSWGAAIIIPALAALFMLERR